MEGQEIHIWMASIDDAPNLYNFLNTEEKCRAAKFKFSYDQNRYIITHSILRHILAAYEGQSASTLTFSKTKYGKPFLNNEKEKETIQFNMSYSKNVVCYIISNKNEVGIDIEYLNVDFEWADIAKSYFLKKELRFLETLPRKEQVKAFYNLWTRKEALLKLKGIGLSGIEEVSTNESKCRLISFNYGLNYQGTLAVDSLTTEIHFYRYIG